MSVTRLTFLSSVWAPRSLGCLVPLESIESDDKRDVAGEEGQEVIIESRPLLS